MLIIKTEQFWISSNLSCTFYFNYSLTMGDNYKIYTISKHKKQLKTLNDKENYFPAEGGHRSR